MKRICKDLEIRPGSRNKRDLAQHILASVSEEQKVEILPRIELYEPSEAGVSVLAAYELAKKHREALMHDQALSCLLRRDVHKAAQIVSNYEAAQIFPRGLGIDWKEGFPETTLTIATVLCNSDFYSDLEVAEPIRLKIAALLTLSEMLGDSNDDAGRRILTATGGLMPCKDLIEFLSADPMGGYASCMDPESPRDLAALYAHTKMFGASNAVQLAQHKDMKVGKGIEILGGDDDGCKPCHPRKRKYKWSELQRLPSLPRHWGCRCLYVAWI